MRHGLEIVSELATRDPYAVAMALGNSVDLQNSFPFKWCFMAYSFAM